MTDRPAPAVSKEGGVAERPEAKPSIGLAHEIATMLWDKGFRGPDGLTVLAMAIGLYVEAQEGSHRNLRPITDAVCKAATMAFDALRAADKAKAGRA